MVDWDERTRHAILVRVSQAVFGVLSLFMMILAGGLVVYSVVQLFQGFGSADVSNGRALLDSIGYAIIAIAVFEVAKFIFEEEVVSPTELRHAGEARRSLTKFISTIAIAIFLEALMAIFETTKGGRIDLMLYPTLLLFAGVTLIVGLGIFQRLSVDAEKAARGVPGEPSSEADLKPEGVLDEDV